MSAYAESLRLNPTAITGDLWMRRVQVIFRSKYGDENGKGIQLTIGDNVYGEAETRLAFDNDEWKILPKKNIQGIDKTSNGNNFSISIRGSKYIALTKDKGTVSVWNLEPDTIALIMAAKLYRIEIKVGYKSCDSLITIAKGEVSYISQKIHSKHDVETYISFASEWVAAWSQSRINFQANSGVNIYAMLEYMMYNKSGVYAKISPSLKKKVLSEVLAANGTRSTIIEQALETQGTAYQLVTDGSLDSNVISVTDLSEKRVIKIDPNMIMIQGGNPTISSEGLAMKLFPVMNLIPGDILQIDNGILDMSTGVSSADTVASSFPTSYVDDNGCYMIQEIHYVFQNRGKDFYLDCKALALNRFKQITGLAT